MAELTRRAALAGLLGVAGQAAVAKRAAAASPVTIIEPFGPNSSTDDAAALLRPALTRLLEAPISVRQVSGDAGGRALDEVSKSPPDGSTLLVAQLLSPFIDPQAEAPERPSFRKMTPIAQLTTGISAALVVSHASPIADWKSFEQRVKAGRLRMAHNPSLLFALPLAMIEAQFGQRFNDVLASTRVEVIAALDGGKADVGFLPTISLLTADDRPPLRPIATFGGARNPWFAGVPTYREVGQGLRTAITGPIVMFGPGGMASGKQPALAESVRTAGNDPEVRKAAAALRYPLQVGGPDLLLESMGRCTRVLRDMRPYLRTPVWKT
ncbi:tripartite tricarboxylate transporter substrate-binding protein [Mesorhizobium sp. IMUNJ 23232]|uniref:tripartite tricarboxylate transporter substrate-binding protein n=1 Tax=Mesorhizobium sp. IMUNJ 23232 TaxID=3376064 RepID=UPI0037A90BA1